MCNAADEIAVSEGCYFEERSAKRVCEFFSQLLRHSKGRFAGKSFDLLPYQKNDIIYPLFGWKRADGTRRFRRAYIEIPKKNGKTTLAAGVTLYLLVGDGQSGAHVFGCGAARDQARLVFDEAANMVDSSPELSAVLQVRRARNVILFPDEKGKYEAIAAEAGIAQGKDAHGVICDELHAWTGREFYESMKYAGRAREQSLFFQITTAGDDMTAICYEEHERALRIVSGEEVESSYFGLIYAAEPSDDWKKPETWLKANPSFGVTINAQDFAIDCKEAATSPRKESAFKRYSLNIWTGATECWLSTDDWGNCGADFGREELEHQPAWAGVDLSRTRDLSAVVWVVPVDDCYYLLDRIFIPENLIDEKEKADKVPYRSWVREGWILATPGDVIDYEFIRQTILEDAASLDVRQIAYDPYNAELLCNQTLRDKDGLDTISIKQSMDLMGPPSSEFEKLVKGGRIRHRRNPVFNWMVGGCTVYEDSNKNIRPIKRRSRSRIDGVVAAIMGLGRAMLQSAGPRLDYYNTNEVESF